MHYYRSYKGMPREEGDERAIHDIMEYLEIERAHLFGDLVQLATCIEHGIPCMSNDNVQRLQTIQGLNMTFGFAGISGQPFHAFCRRYCLNKYREWLGDAYATDEQGFPIQAEES